MAEQVQALAVRLIDAGRYQPRRRFDEAGLAELAASIREQGIIQPLIVRPTGSRFELIAGERRLRAAQRIGLVEVPAIVRRYSDEQALEAALIENLQRQDLSVVEAARAYQRLAEEFHYSQAEIALRTGKSRPAVSNTLRLLHLPEAVLEMLDSGALTEGHARPLLALPYPSLQVEVAEWVVRNAVPVRETERKVQALVRQEEGAARGRAPAARSDANLAALEEQLRARFGTKALVSYRAGRGSVTLEFYSDDDLERILEELGLTS
jgi:ParB family transcriptional regulator, chromosome partitioning protein